MNDRHALMAALIANPDEDTPRLALADWLLEYGDRHDQARAEFIRCQITASLGGPEARSATRRASTIRRAQLRHWLGPLIDHQVRIRNLTFTFIRGILNKWYVTPSEFLQRSHQKVVTTHFPLLGLHQLLWYNPTRRVERLVHSAALEWVANVWWNASNLGDDGFHALARSPCFARLSGLTIGMPACTDDGLNAFAESSGFPNLRSLQLHNGSRARFSVAGLCRILDSTHCRRLDQLDLTGTHRSEALHPSLFQCKSLSRLRMLTLPSGTDLMALAHCTHLTNLEFLEIDSAVITDDIARTMMTNPTFARLTTLGFYRTNAQQPRLDKRVEAALRDHFGSRLTLNYANH